jgi:hypothetical protein
MPLRFAFLLLALAPLPGCDRGATGPANTRTTSATLGTLAERTRFLERYVTFRRTYETLDFDVMFQDNGGGGGVPGPSDWDVRLVATVPTAELNAWVPTGATTPTTAPSAADQDWLKSVPTALDLGGVTEWYVDGRRVVGIDRGRRIVVYRNWAM